MDYELFYKDGPVKKEGIPSLGRWDILISAFNQSERVNTLFENTISDKKYWVVHPEYRFSDSELPTTGKEIFTTDSSIPESQFAKKFFNFLLVQEGIDVSSLKDYRVCIDSTGFLRPHLMCFILYLKQVAKMQEFDIVYSEPEKYRKEENTEFSIGAIEEVRFVEGFSPALDRDTSKDLLIIGAGYDQDLLSEVVDDKIHANIIQIVGFPSLQPDMYQQCRLKTHDVEVIGEEKKPYFAPANDPFITAGVVRDIVEKKRAENQITNLYLSPLGTKAQTIGFVLYYLIEMADDRHPGGIIFPVRESYSKETSVGFSKAWAYHIEFDAS